MTKSHLKHPLEPPPATSSSHLEDDAESWSEEDDVVDEHTIFSSDEEDEPEPEDNHRVVKQGTKRPSEDISMDDDDDKSSKRSKKVTATWSNEDEIAMLQGMIDFKTNSWRMEGFYESVKNSISFQVSQIQFSNKIRSLKRKYARRGQTFLKAHENKCYELSKLIWGPKRISTNRESKANGTKKLNDESLDQDLSKGDDDVLVNGGGGDAVESLDSDWVEKSFLSRSMESVGVDEHMFRERWSNVPIKTKKKIKEKLKLLEALELKCALQKTQLLHKVTSVIAQSKLDAP